MRRSQNRSPQAEDKAGCVNKRAKKAAAGEDYERLISWGEPTAVTPDDERSLLSINYTSGTTSNPKGSEPRV